MAQIEHFALFADDAPALRDFYIEVMGLRLVLDNQSEPPGYFLADDHGNALEIIGRTRAEMGKEVNPRWTCHVAFYVEDYDASRANLKQRGLVFETESAVDNAEIRTSFFRDPAGNRTQIIWRKRRLGQ